MFILLQSESQLMKEEVMLPLSIGFDMQMMSKPFNILELLNLLE